MASNSQRSSTDGALSVTQTHDILSNTRRRTLISILATQDQPLDLTALAEQVGSQERPQRTGTLEEAVRERIRLSLVHIHLPKLDALGVVAYNSSTRQVEKGEQFQRFEAALESDTGSEIMVS